MSLTCPTVPISATTRPWWKTGVTRAISNKCPAQSQGSFVTNTSPGCNVSAGKCSSSAFTQRVSVRLKSGMARGECASGLPCGSRISFAKSCASAIIREYAVRQTVCHISSTMEIKRDHMISSPMGSASMRAMAVSSAMPGVTRASDLAVAPTAMRRLRTVSTVSASPGAMIVVASRSSIIAGPARLCPGLRR